MLSRALRLCAALVLGVASNAAAAAESTAVVVGSDGASYRLWSGTFAEIFGANPALPESTPILALDVVPPGQALLRYLVPGTEGAETESSALLVHDPGSDSVHLLWNTRTVANQTFSRIALRSYAATGWSELTEISAGSLSDKTHLQAKLVHDDYATRLDGVAVRIPRRILHLVWSESASGTARSFYTPVVFVAGRYLGWNPVVSLDELAAGETSAAAPAPAEMAAAPVLAGVAGTQATAVFIQSASQRLVTVELDAIPGELSELAEMARGHIVELIQSGIDDRDELAEMARGHIVELATQFHASTAGYLSDGVAALIEAASPDLDGATLAEMARGHIVELGREILGAGLVNYCADEGILLGIPPLVPAAGTNFDHQVAARRVASWELPEGTAAGHRVFTSPGGENALVGWETAERVFYRETVTGGGWSELRSLDLSQMTAAEAWSALARRAARL